MLTVALRFYRMIKLLRAIGDDGSLILQPNSAIVSGNERSSLGDFALLFFAGRPSGAWQLQYGCLLALAKVGDQHNLSIRELERIMMRRRPIEVDLSEASHPVR